MTIQQFIEAAIEGGWKNDGQKVTNSLQKDVTRALFSPQMTRLTSLQDMCLDPEAWKAVGKVKGWAEMCDPYCRFENCADCSDEGAMQKMAKMLPFLWSGKTLEEYIATL